MTTPPAGPDDVPYDGSDDGDPYDGDTSRGHASQRDAGHGDPGHRDPAGGAAANPGRTIGLVATLVLAAAAAFGITTLVVGNSEPDPEPTAAATSSPSSQASSPSPEPSPSEPPAADLIQDGPDFGFLASIAEDGQVLQLDRATFLTGDEANAEAERRGLEVPVPNDYLITNDNPQLRDYPINPDVQVTLTTPLVPDAVSSDPVEASLTELQERLADVDAADSIPFDLVLRDGQVVEINQMYVP